MTVMSLEDTRAARPEADEYAPYYGTYIGKVGDGDIVRALAGQIGETLALLESIPESKAGHRYAEGKWSIREVIGHLCDAERIFGYRALRFARGDATPLPGFDEKSFVANARFDERSLTSMADELDAVRRASIVLFDGLFPEEWLRRGTSNGQTMSVRAFAWIAAGHERHHLDILRTRYLRFD
ncbi:MAG TPA: DinB family protein [Gemmatimonadaceae bacterium]